MRKLTEDGERRGVDTAVRTTEIQVMGTHVAVAQLALVIGPEGQE